MEVFLNQDTECASGKEVIMVEMLIVVGSLAIMLGIMIHYDSRKQTPWEPEKITSGYLFSNYAV